MVGCGAGVGKPAHGSKAGAFSPESAREVWAGHFFSPGFLL